MLVRYIMGSQGKLFQCCSCPVLPFRGLQFAFTVVMPIVAMAHISLRVFILRYPDEVYSGGLIEYLAMKTMNSVRETRSS